MTKEEIVVAPQPESAELSYHSLNAMLNHVDENGNIDFETDKKAARQYFIQHVNRNTVFFHTLEEKLNYLVEENYYEKEVLDQYDFAFIKSLFKRAYDYKFRFQSFIGAYKYYTSYTLKTFDGSRYLERFEDRVVMNGLYLAQGDTELAEKIVDEIMTSRFQPATPTFLNAGKKQRGELVSCFPAGTMVDTENGPVAIESIVPGTRVLSHDGEYHEVEKLSKRDNTERLVEISLTAHDPIRSTPEHPILVRSTRNVSTIIDGDGATDGLVWLAAQDVRAGDFVIRVENEYLNQEIAVTDVDTISYVPSTVYNLHVADTHTYSVNGIIVHNCFLLRFEDNMESIGRNINSALQLSKRGGGVAFNLTNLRETGAPIKNVENQSSGVVPVMKILEDSFSYANQLGSRQGAGAVYLNAHHPDIYNFLDTKRENADEKVRIKSLSTGVIIPDITFELIRKKEDMYLFSPYDVERVYGKAFSDISVTEEYYNMVNNDSIRKKKINPRELIQTIAELQFESGYPYLMFEDNANKGTAYKERVNMSNLCVTGDTRILTDKGYIPIGELYDNDVDNLKVLSDNRAVTKNMDNTGMSVKDSTKVFKTGENQEVFTVESLEGPEITATSYHKFFVEEDGQVVEKRTWELEPGDKMLVQSGEGSFGDIHEPDLAYIAGVIAADGTITRNVTSTGVTTSTAKIYLYGDKATEVDAVQSAVHRVLEGKEELLERQSTTTPVFVESVDVDRTTLHSAPLAKVLLSYGVTKENKGNTVPEFVWRGDRETQIAYLSGVIQMDGSVTGSKESGTTNVEVGSVSKPFLQSLQTILMNLGVYTRIYDSRSGGMRMMPDGKGGYKEYNTKQLYSLRAGGADRDALMEIMNLRACQRAKYNDFIASKGPNRRSYSQHKHRVTVRAVVPAGRQDVYDVTVEDGHTVTFVTYVTSNCSEILQTNEASTYNDDLGYKHLGKDISCNLGSLNVTKAFDSNDFEQTIETAIRCLTTVSELSDIATVPSIQNGNSKSHAIGLGQMNLHGFLGREHIHYDSPEAVDFTNIYFYSVLYHCLKASHKIAVEKGATFEGFEDSAYADGSFFTKYIDKDWSQPETTQVARLMQKSSMFVPTPKDWEALRDDIMADGIYNKYLQAVPPTGSISYINHSTSSIHPIASRVEIRKEGKIGRVYYAAPHMTNENIEYFRDAYEIGPDAIVNVYAAATQHIDQGLSLTMFYDDSANIGTLVKNYINAWRKGIKTMYYARIRQSALKGTEVEGLASSMSPVKKPATVVTPEPDDEGPEECESCML